MHLQIMQCLFGINAESGTITGGLSRDDGLAMGFTLGLTMWLSLRLWLGLQLRIQMNLVIHGLGRSYKII